MKSINVLGIDLAKSVFELCGQTKHGRVIYRRQVRRAKLLETVAQIPPCIIGMEACGGAHHWAREFEKLGHVVKIMAPQYVKPYVKRHKNDRADAEAICEAVSRPTMRFVSAKSVEQQQVQLFHRTRERLVRDRTSLLNQARGALSELGIAVPKGVTHIRKYLVQRAWMEDDRVPAGIRRLLSLYAQQQTHLEEQIGCIEVELNEVYETNPVCKQLAKIPGVGVLTATALVATVGNPNDFKNGRQFAAYLGLVPKQCSSGGKEVLLGISKQGDRYLRTLLIHGARATMQFVSRKTDKRSRWILQLRERRGFNRTAVAAANKAARVAWALMKHGTAYAT